MKFWQAVSMFALGMFVGWLVGAATNELKHKGDPVAVSVPVVEVESPSVSPLTLADCDILLIDAAKESRGNASPGSAMYAVAQGTAALACYESFKAVRSAPVREGFTDADLTGLLPGTVQALKHGMFQEDCPNPVRCLAACAFGKPCRLRELEGAR